MKKNITLLLSLVLGVFSIVSCEETMEEPEFGNWKQRNDRFIDSIAQVARANDDGSWRVFLGESIDTLETANDYYVYCKVLESGSATEHPNYNDTILANYRGHLIPSRSYSEGYVFDETYKGVFDPEVDVPMKLNLSGCVRGWITAVEEMVKGDTWRVYVPYELGYGAESRNSIPAYSTLIFDINLVDFAPVGTPIK